MERETKNVAIQIDTHRKLKSLAAQKNVPLGEAATEGAELWIKQHGGTKQEEQQQQGQEPERGN